MRLAQNERGNLRLSEGARYAGPLKLSEHTSAAGSSRTGAADH